MRGGIIYYGKETGIMRQQVSYELQTCVFPTEYLYRAFLVLGFASFLSGQSIFLPWAMKPLTQLKTPFGAKLRERLTELGEG